MSRQACPGFGPVGGEIGFREPPTQPGRERAWIVGQLGRQEQRSRKGWARVELAAGEEGDAAEVECVAHIARRNSPLGGIDQHDQAVAERRPELRDQMDRWCTETRFAMGHQVNHNGGAGCRQRGA